MAIVFETGFAVRWLDSGLERALTIVSMQAAGAKDTLATRFDVLESKLETKIHASANRIVRHIYMAVLGQTTVLLGFAYFFATHLPDR